MSEAYGKVVRFLVSRRITVGVMLLLFAGLLGATVYMLQVTPRGFIPPMDQGYAIVVIQLPQGSSLSRTDAVTREASEIIQATPGVRDAVAFAGFSGATFTSSSDAAVVFAGFEPFEERLAQGITSDAIIGNLFRSEEHTSELQSLMRISYAVFCLKKKKKKISIYKQEQKHVI